MNFKYKKVVNSPIQLDNIYYKSFPPIRWKTNSLYNTGQFKGRTLGFDPSSVSSSLTPVANTYGEYINGDKAGIYSCLYRVRFSDSPQKGS